MSYNLAVCLIRSGHYQASQELLEAAQTELVQAHANLADVLLVRGKLAALQGADGEALKFAEAVFEHPLSFPSPQHQVEARLLQSQLAAQQGELDRAKSLLQTVQQQRSTPYDDLVLAQIHRTSGHIQAEEKHFQAAAAAFDKEAAFSRRAKRFDLMAKALDRAAAAYEKSGHFGWAADRWFRAARSYSAQHAEQCFEMAINAAFRAAQKSEDPLL
jgi:tetratricopeptide (TPR) repeat protein